MGRMTTGKIAQMKAMRDQGMTYQEIGDAMGYTRQYVCNLVGHSRKYSFRTLYKEDCVYPGLRKWMNDNKVSRAEMLRRMGKETWPSSTSRLSAYLRGENNPSKAIIDDILRVTGLTYEQCFGGRDDGR